jgi:protein TonB
MRGPILILGIVLSLAAHSAISFGISAIPKDVGKKSHLIAVVDSKKKKKKKEEKPEEEKPAKADEPPPPPKPIQPPRPAPKAKAPPENTPPPPTNAHAANAATHAALAALPSLGISMAGGPGGGGIAVPMGGGDVAPVGGPAPEAKAAAKPKDDCTEEVVKPKLSGGLATGGIKAAAQAEGREGKVRLEILVDENGNVTAVRILTGLGGSIDQAALAAAKQARLTPATRCGRKVAGRLLVSIPIVSE